MTSLKSNPYIPTAALAQLQNQVQEAKKIHAAMNISISTLTYDSSEGERWGVLSEAIDLLAKVSIAISIVETFLSMVGPHWSEE